MTRQKPDPSPRDAQDEAARWELVPLTDYSLPPTPAASAARARWTSLRRLFARGSEPAETPARAEADLRGLPEPVLDALVAPVDWSGPAEALQQRREQDDAAGALTCVVGPPRSGHVALLHRWASAAGARVLEPPGADEILAGGRTWLDAWPEDDRPWLLPRLEHCWLRHAAGLALVRELLERVQAGRLGPGVIGCDSWAWAYLRRVAALPTQCVLTLQAFDGPGLAALFRNLLALDNPRPVQFRNAQTGKLVLAVDGEDDGDGGAELQHLAARARGNAGLARLLWRRRLRAEPDSAEGADEADAATADDEASGATIWLAAPPTAPALTADLDEAAALLLHALLLHNGLSAALLAELLPLPPYRVQMRLQWLAALGAVVAGADGRWRIHAVAYSAARDLLRAQGFLLDDF
ncbi:hypothetical protein CKO31_01915 [Thiohalocapsa halophila]|uniref:ATP-binding protein n=1 Tax=Thiohalocapsa halophila TaxID=69359 RepID=A0ABS1CC80_9GAMM|nr:hypothetical protein [Thiohalocapsa halophila]MBK1629512.1 hypothetical protein [Thiohalocapsa halophila]